MDPTMAEAVSKEVARESVVVCDNIDNVCVDSMIVNWINRKLLEKSTCGLHTLEEYAAVMKYDDRKRLNDEYVGLVQVLKDELMH
ncbi:general transcription and DNA repair factor IIH helicase subunit XPD-like [Uranotaenia lowii]|uniref:general transcription and DNA repair factor IIH helicase subunit XPD-like n=1 Tax=Uranotaenia lowii TaxID=190385 RepID=UPI00247948BA|nr:general transcription and DNA repair factor IIH helicase subunit XPD-like [Uranotaenia lowii]